MSTDTTADLEGLVASLLGDALSRAETVPSIGVDVEDLARWRDGAVATAALFTADELARCESFADPAAQLAGIWCAKEAVVKSASAHVTLSLRDVEITHDRTGRPSIVVRRAGCEHHAERFSVSISRTPSVAVAVAAYFPNLPAGDEHHA